MAQPTPYDRQANFSDEEALNPTGKTPGASLDAELNAVKITSDETLANLALIQRDDGALKNGIVSSDSLSPSLSIGFTLRGAWAAGVNYVLNDGVTLGSKFYRAASSHLSSSLNEPTDVGAPWAEVADFDAAAAAAGVAAGIAANAATIAAIQDGLLGAQLIAAIGLDRGLTVSAASGALTINLTTAANTTPSLAGPIQLAFPATTSGNGGFTRYDVVSGLSLVLSSGSTLGAAAINDAFAVWVVVFDDGGTLRLGAINCRNGSTVFPLGKTRRASAVAEGGAGAADTAATFYAGAAITAKAYVVIGRLVWESGLATLGTWTVPSDIEIWRPETALPGDKIQKVVATNGTEVTTTGATPLITSSTASIALTSAANLVEAEAIGSGSNSNATFSVNFQLSRSSTFTAVGLANSIFIGSVGPMLSPITLSGTDKPNTVSTTAYYVFVWGTTAGQWLPSNSPALTSRVVLTEIQT